MAKIAALMERPSAGRRRPQDARNGPWRGSAPNGDALMEQVLANMNTTPQQGVLKKIAALPRARQDKVLDIRRQLTEGTYEVAGRLDRAMDQVLAAITNRDMLD